MFGKFFITALTPVVYNVGIILGVTFFYPIWGVVGLAYGVILGAIFHIGIQIPLLIRSGLVPSITHVIVWSEIKAMVKTSIPRTLALSLSSFTLIILTAIASRMSSGSISIFTLTNNILNVPIAIIGISYSVASFPTLIKLYQNSNYKDFVDHILYATKKIIFWAVPVLVLFVILRAQIIRVILGTQSFSWNDTRLAAASLAIFVVGVVSQSLIHLFVRSYYAAGNTRRPLITAIISQLVIISSAFAFLSLFRTNEVFTDIVRNVLRLEGIITLDLLALPMAFVLGNITNGFLLFYFLNKDFSIRQYRQLCVTSVQTIIASIGMGLTTYALLNILAPVINQQVFLGILGQGILAGLGGMLVFGSILLMMKNQDIIDLLKIMKGKFWKKDIVIMEQIEIDQ
jgi:putative peptidoglycan lipid II flippase